MTPKPNSVALIDTPLSAVSSFEITVGIGDLIAEARDRRLAAILAADVVGYSRLMGADEAGTLAALKRHREAIFDPAVASHNGRIWSNLIGGGAVSSSVAWSMR